MGERQAPRAHSSLLVLAFFHGDEDVPRKTNCRAGNKHFPYKGGHMVLDVLFIVRVLSNDPYNQN